MHPASTALLLIGYGLSLPVLLRFGHVLRTRNRLALLGHQIGMLSAATGWLLHRRVAVVLAHLLWVVATRVLWTRTAERDHR